MGASVCSTPCTNLDSLSSSSQNVKKKNTPISPLNNLWHPTASTCCLCWTSADVNSLFSKMYVHARCFVQGYRALCVFKLLILWSWRRRFLCLCIHNIYAHSLCIIEPYVWIQTYVRVWTRSGSRFAQCVLATGLVRYPHYQLPHA